MAKEGISNPTPREKNFFYTIRLEVLRPGTGYNPNRIFNLTGFS